MFRRLAVASLCFAVSLPAAENRTAQGLNQFGIACYRELDSGRDNLIFSPFSISSALSMALAGARGQTAAEIAAVLHQNYPDAQYPAALMALANQLSTRANGGGNQFLNANGLWVQRGFSIEPDFLRTLETTYAAPLTPLDFERRLEQARAAINFWTDEHTKGKIHELFGPGSLDGRTRLILTSAVYFFGKWERPFSSKRTAPATFKLGSGRTVQTPFMHRTASFGYAETESLQILEMRYAGTGVAWDVLLPKAESGLRNLEDSFTPENLAGWLGRLSPRKVELAMPKFRAEAEFSLRDELSRMGMPSAFGAADFSGIDGRRDLALAGVVHKALVDVSEEGTEAAAATGAIGVLVSVVTPDHTVFRADHPFMFLIRDTSTGLILFAGRLTDPSR